MLIFKYKMLSALFVTFSLIYLLHGILIPPDKAILEKYDVSAGQMVGLLLTITIPYVVIWFVALVGYLRFRHYTQSIKGSKDGAAFTIICKGLLLFTLWLPLSALTGTLTDHYADLHPSATANMVRLDNYVNLLLLLPAFLLVNQGAKKLLAIIRQSANLFPQKGVILFIIFASLYVFLVLQDPARQLPTESVKTAAYYTPDWVTLTTMIIPRLIMWFLGAQTVYYIYSYAKRVKGSLYKDALNTLGRGLGAVVVAVIALRCFQSLSTQVAYLNLGLLLLVVYALLGIIASGYILILKGAKKLQRIEEL